MQLTTAEALRPFVVQITGELCCGSCMKPCATLQAILHLIMSSWSQQQARWWHLAICAV